MLLWSKGLNQQIMFLHFVPAEIKILLSTVRDRISGLQLSV